MKNKKALLFSLAAILSGSTLMAQQNWKVGGNALTATGKFGSTSANDINFISNNVSRISLKSSGNLRINSDQTSILFANPGATPKPMMFIYESGNSNTARMVMAYSPLFPNYGLKYNGFDKFDFTNGAFTALDVDLTNSRIGVGTGSPKTRLHVVNGISGVSPIANTTITAENNTNNYISVLTPSSAESGILFGNPANAASGGIIYNNGGAQNGFQFRTFGNITRMTLTNEGNLAVGTNNPENFKLKIVHDNNPLHGLAIENSTLSEFEWSFFTGGGNSPLNLFRDGALMGQFSFPSGQYLALSDEKLKTNIRAMSSVLEKINQLKPSTYQFKKAIGEQDYDGFIAQDVMKIFPSLVSHFVNKESNTDVYTMNYSGFGVIAIKGIQELMKQNEQKDSAIKDLQKQIDELKAIVLKGNTAAEAKINTSLTNVLLEQNMPNPFTNATTIRYNIPQKFVTAQIIITDNNGRQIKQVNISSPGKGSINVEASS